MASTALVDWVVVGKGRRRTVGVSRPLLIHSQRRVTHEENGESMTDPMRFVLEPVADGVAVGRFTGRLDFASAPEARAQFTRAIADGCRELIVDLSGVAFVDSAGLGSLIGGMRTARQAGGDLRIAKPNDQLVMLLSLTSLDQVLKVYASIEDAIAAFA